MDVAMVVFSANGGAMLFLYKTMDGVETCLIG